MLWLNAVETICLPTIPCRESATNEVDDNQLFENFRDFPDISNQGLD